ncbi:MAG: FtsX-like permease family protein [Saprospiraceae bacterium]
MNMIWLPWKNLWLHPLRSVFNMMLVAIAVALIVILLLINVQFGQHLGKSSEKIDAILAAKGSPLQSVLCNIFHLDAPTGNIKVGEIKPFLRAVHPLIANACPLALGDSYHKSRIIGTTDSYFRWMELSLREGRMFEQDFEAVIGSELADHEHIRTGDTLMSNHGLTALDLDTKHEHGLRVVGILESKNNLADKLIFTTISTYWKEHDHGDTEGELSAHQDTPVLRNSDLENIDNDKTLTSVLIQFKGHNIQSLNFVRNVNEGSKLMAVSPAIEISRLYELTGTASDMLYWIAVIIGILSMFAIFINLIQALEERRPELGILRIGGASRSLLFSLMMIEGLLISLIGTITGWLLAHGLLEMFSHLFDLNSRYGIKGLYLAPGEWILILLSAMSGLVAALIPSVRAYREEIAGLLRL